MTGKFLSYQRKFHPAKTPFSENSIWKKLHLANVSIQREFHLAKIPYVSFSENSIQRKFLFSECFYSANVSIQRQFHLAKIPFSENFHLAKVSFSENSIQRKSRMYENSIQRKYHLSSPTQRKYISNHLCFLI